MNFKLMAGDELVIDGSFTVLADKTDVFVTRIHQQSGIHTTPSTYRP